jgi:hypothetical protein
MRNADNLVKEFQFYIVNNSKALRFFSLQTLHRKHNYYSSVNLLFK